MKKFYKKLIIQKVVEGSMDTQSERKRTKYDDDLYAKLEQVKTEKEARKQELCLPVPLPSDETMEDIMTDIHLSIARSDQKASLDFVFYKKYDFEFPIFYKDATEPWLEPVKQWLKEAKTKLGFGNLSVEERAMVFDHVKAETERFFAHICAVYNAKHSFSRAAAVPLHGFRIYY